MAVEPVVVFRGVRSSAALLEEIRRLAGNLEKFSSPITKCDVAVEWSERHHHSGNRFRIRIEVIVPGRTIVVSHGASNHADLQESDLVHIPKRLEINSGPALCEAAIRAAFATARRRLRDHARRQRETVKRGSAKEIRLARAEAAAARAT